jgi:thiosulfate dehydrogenase [quinone] large subunit
MNLKERTYLWYIVPLRLYVGYYLLNQGIRKYQLDFPHGDWIGSQIGDLDKVDLYPWYKAFLTGYVVPHRELFGYLVTAGEILVGVCLLLGLFTRFSAIVGLLMMVNYYLGPGMARGGVSMAQQQIFIVSLAIILLANPGRTLGLDGFIFRGGRGLR